MISGVFPDWSGLGCARRV
nr:hypothetical protein [Tanacetum cinerariifolium]